ncbi:MAG: hypothetical protein ACREOY_02400, partial [Candidatus Dormibacteraceae bacterium]
MLIYDPEIDRVQCHLCGHWYRSVGRHAWTGHGWRHSQYVEAFGLAQQRALCTPSVSTDQSRRMKGIYVASPDMRENLRRGQGLLKDPEVRKQWRQPRDTARRPERLLKLKELMGVLQQGQTDLVRERRRRRLLELGFEDLDAYLSDRYVDRQMTLREIATELGAGNEFVSRAVAQLGLKQVLRRPGRRLEPPEARRRRRLQELGFENLEEYLRIRYVDEGWTSHDIARELGVHYSFV